MKAHRKTVYHKNAPEISVKKNGFFLSSQLIKTLRSQLLAWYRREARDLPWRRVRDPYAIWVSEIMLQQTQVETAVPYFLRFMRQFPNLQALARAKSDQVLKLWEGLGYYRRAHHLWQAARQVAVELNGQLPQTLDGWKRLPGVGAYTAGAITSIAFNQVAPILDGNVKRILSRIFTLEEDLETAVLNKRLWYLAEALVPAESPGDFNQSMMELGALVCKVDQPRCTQCPVQRTCRAFARGEPQQWPRKKKSAPRPHQVAVAGVLRERGRFLIGKRPEGGLLGGLWEFPGGKVEKGETLAQALRREFHEEVGLNIEVGNSLGVFQHAYTHFSLTLHAFFCTRQGGRLRAHWHQALRWITPDGFKTYAFPGVNQKIFRALDHLEPFPIKKI
jgi:A/G-specific adenine glycosylase